MLIRIKETISDHHELQQRFVWLQNEVTQTEGEKQHLINQLAIAEKKQHRKYPMENSINPLQLQKLFQ